ncbi:D-ribose pyranase, partial [Mammaliicoccus sciuri]
MYKTGILNSEISKLLSDLGHTDQIIIADCGLPVPQGVKKIDLALDFGKPSFLEVFHIIKNHMVIEQV